MVSYNRSIINTHTSLWQIFNWMGKLIGMQCVGPGRLGDLGFPGSNPTSRYFHLFAIIVFIQVNWLPGPTHWIANIGFSIQFRVVTLNISFECMTDGSTAHIMCCKSTYWYQNLHLLSAHVQHIQRMLSSDPYMFARDLSVRLYPLCMIQV